MKPLLICDCDEVLLHMVCHFGTWLRETHDICFSPDGGDFARSMTRQDGTRPTPEEMWGLLGEFFPAEMHRQTLVRSEEHTSELQSLMRISYAVFSLKKKTTFNETSHEYSVTAWINEGIYANQLSSEKFIVSKIP